MADPIQDVLANIAQQQNPQPQNPANPPAPQPQNPNPQPQNPQPQQPNESEAARNAAFAQMRIENARLQSELEALKKQLNLQQPNPPAPQPQPQSPANDDRAELAKRLEALEKRETERAAAVQQARIVNELTSIRDKYALGPEQLQQFAKDAANQGIDLRTTDRSFESIYRDLHFVELIEAEVNRRLNPRNPVPATGPQGGGAGTKSIPPISDVIAKLTKDTNSQK